MPAGVKNNLPLGWRKIRAIAAGEDVTKGDDSGDVDIGRPFEAVILDFVKDKDSKPVVFFTDAGFEAYVCKIRIEEKSDASATGNKLFIDPSTFSDLSDVVGNFFEDTEQAKNFYVNMHPEGVYVNDDPAKEVPKIGDMVNATSERIQGRYIITAKFGTAANKEGGYGAPPDNAGKGARTAIEFGTNGTPITGYPQVFLKNSSVRWDCLDPKVKAAVNQIATETNLAITITSAYRNKADTAAVGSSDNSQHTYGQAVDLRTRDKTTEELHLIKKAALNAGFKNPPALLHGTAEHYHFEYITNKNKASTAQGCADEIAVAFGRDQSTDTGQSLVTNEGMSSINGTTES
tara:strand:- start:3988 stop:5028 length:1041 start_codon:yes stop_codon:yes gene_type:complete